MDINFKNEDGYLKIEYIIGLFFLLRLIGITNAPLEIAHNWRQVTGLMVARNFLEVDLPVYYLAIQTEFIEGEEDFNNLIINYVRKNKGNG